MKHARVLLATAISFIAFSSYAVEKHVCKSGATERTIEVVYEVEGKTLPCKVNYEKSETDGGSTQGLYTATTQEGFCTEKANELKARLESGGFTCTSEGQAETTPAAEIKEPPSEEKKTE